MSETRKVFGLGLSRTGTTSLGGALNKLGISTKHYPYDRTTYAELTSGTYRLAVLEKFDAIVDITVAPYYAQLDQAYPGSKFILTTRDVESWLQAIEKHFAFLESWDDMNDQFRRFTEFINACVFGSLRFNADRFRYVYETHLTNVSEYFRGRPDSLLTMDICGGEGWDRLCDFLDTPVPGEPFPHRDLHQELAEWRPPAGQGEPGQPQDSSVPSRP
jgi:Sulfotransferase domain